MDPLTSASAASRRLVTTPNADTRVRFDRVTKVFSGTAALDAVSFDIRRGEIHALLGANGAGKSTLIKALAGLYPLDSGNIQVHDDHDGRRTGVAFIHQDLALIPDLTVSENIALVVGYPRRGRRVDWRAVEGQAHAALAQVGGGIDIHAKVEQLTRADQSIVAIARALFTNCALVVLDEPTASLPDADVDRLFQILLALHEEGVSVLYVTHRLDEVRRIADHVTVLRDGQVVADRRINDISDGEIVSAIVGTTVMPHQRGTADRIGEPVVTLTGGALTPEAGRLNYQLYPGEIVGFAGLRGSGQEQAGRALAGIAPLPEGRYGIDGRQVPLHGVRSALKLGIGFATSRREAEALAMTLTVRENLFMNPRKSRNPVRLPSRERTAATRLVRDVQLRPPDPEAIAGTLSGGNQQKVVLGRWLDADLRVLVLEEPTMGIDVGSRAELYGLLQKLAKRGLAIVVVSSDFEELATICHRVLIFDGSVIRAELIGAELQLPALTHLASGGRTHDHDGNNA